MAFLDETGLSLYDSKIKEYIASKSGSSGGAVTVPIYNYRVNSGDYTVSPFTEISAGQYQANFLVEPIEPVCATYNYNEIDLKLTISNIDLSGYDIYPDIVSRDTCGISIDDVTSSGGRYFLSTTYLNLRIYDNTGVDVHTTTGVKIWLVEAKKDTTLKRIILKARQVGPTLF